MAVPNNEFPSVATDWTKLQFHSLAEKLPPMSDDEFSKFVEDIRTNGLRVPITTYQGQVLDGRHRYRALKQIGRVPTEKDFVEYKPIGSDTPIKFIISQNVNRRHLNESQRSLFAAEIATLEKGANQHSKGSSIDLPTAATMLNVGEASVKRAKNFLAKAAPELIEQVRQGKRRVGSVSTKVLKKSHAEQLKALATDGGDDDNPSDKYDNAEKSLIKKLQALAPDVAEAAATATIKKLKDTVGTMLRAAENTKKAA